MSKKNYNYEEVAALPDTFERTPPDDYEDGMDHEVVQDSTGALQTAAHKVGGLLSRLSKQEIDMIYAALAPMTKKLRWYDSRYRQMQNKISYLSDTVKDLTKENLKLRRMLSDLGGKFS